MAGFIQKGGCHIRLLSAIALSLGLYLYSGCALYKSGQGSIPIVTQCIIPPDQTGTISGHWQVTPIPIAFHQDDFSAAEMGEMVAAAATWNKFFGESKKKQVIDPGTAEQPRTSPANNPRLEGPLCSKGVIQGTAFSGNIVLYKLGTWPSNYPANAMALTSFCTLASSSYANMYMAIMEINYQTFFTQGKKVPDLQSIILHELGHLLGLNHSCEAATKAGTPNCNDPNLNPEYGTASMYPVFSFDQSGAGQQKRSLGTNDQGRANCLY